MSVACGVRNNSVEAGTCYLIAERSGIDVRCQPLGFLTRKTVLHGVVLGDHETLMLKSSIMGLMPEVHLYRLLSHSPKRF